MPGARVVGNHVPELAAFLPMVVPDVLMMLMPMPVFPKHQAACRVEPDLCCP